ncbi:hypothetical protein [Thiocystis violascens]|uniref:Uncharacterized protein n=1 Tax=Thiocystis violascens (strain ATCC 17096 / DSM 198 / 6111) TaxID=765911 RepID=I3YAY8_THIV6|nr:hypothetical protein [Thiocystis violascens]AFL74156.1 hypothetical protein Thivi_2206 [Thiocystis violascens DSM 198]
MDRSDTDSDTDREEIEPVPLATCICQRSGFDQQARLDNRSSHPDCSDACCQQGWESSADGACQSDDCEFVAQCGGD